MSPSLPTASVIPLPPVVPLIKAPSMVEERLSHAERASVKQDILRRMAEQNATLVAHYYTSGDIQDLADESGGFVSDSLEMARFGHKHPAKTLIVAGVRFMGETAKLLNPEKRVLMPDSDAHCSLDLACPAEAFARFCDAHPDRDVVVYSNTSAEVKARADWVVTSGSAIRVINHLKRLGRKILWAPDRHLGRYVQQTTGADMLIWQGSCVVHEAFRADSLARLKAEHPEAAILVHPESPRAVIELADVVGSTSRLIEAARDLPHPTMIVATDNGILHRMRQTAPDKLFLEAPTHGPGATCTSCAHCPWMAMNGLRKIQRVLATGDNEIHIDPDLCARAARPIARLLDFTAQVTRSAARRGA